jgi:hypothetical protein
MPPTSNLLPPTFPTERICRSLRCFPFLIPPATGTKTLKRNEFGSHLDWSKTCELDDVFFHIPQEARP